MLFQIYFYTLLLIPLLTFSLSAHATSLGSSTLATTSKNSSPTLLEQPVENRGTEASSSPAFQKEIEVHKALLSKKRQDRVYNLLQNIIGRMHAVVWRFHTIADRIDSRAHKVEKGAAPREEIMKHVTLARGELESATAVLNSDLGAFAHSVNPIEQFQLVRTKIQEVGGHLRTAQAELRTALFILELPSVPPIASSTITHI